MLAITLPKNVNITWGADFVKVTGPLGTIIKRKADFELAIKETKLYLWSPKDPQKEAAFLKWLNALIIGVEKGYRQKLKLVGVGYKASVSDNRLYLKVGFSHELFYIIPEDLQIKCSKAKGTMILIQGIELQRVKQVATDIRMLRAPDAYKGKGIHFYKEELKLKKGKREGK